MKKLIFLVAFALIIFSFYISQSENQSSSSPIRPSLLTKQYMQQSMGKQEELTETLNSESVSKAQESVTETLSIHEIERELMNKSDVELRAELERTKKLISQKGLIEKSNQNALTAFDKEELRLFLRKQGVINFLITKNRIQRLKESKL